MIIYLGRTLPCASSGDTREVSGQLQPSPIRPCSGWGLPSLRLATELVVSYTTVSAFLDSLSSKRQANNTHLAPFTQNSKGFLFCGTFPGPNNGLVAAGNHPALWSPDFPRRFLDAITRLAHLHGNSIYIPLQAKAPAILRRLYK